MSKLRRPKDHHKVFREEILELKYQFFVARQRFASGEITAEKLHEHAEKLIEAIRMRRTQLLGNARWYRLKLSASELIANPFFASGLRD
jgi:hypothetical protein